MLKSSTSAKLIAPETAHSIFIHPEEDPGGVLHAQPPAGEQQRSAVEFLDTRPGAAGALNRLGDCPADSVIRAYSEDRAFHKCTQKQGIY